LDKKDESETMFYDMCFGIMYLV